MKSVKIFSYFSATFTAHIPCIRDVDFHSAIQDLFTSHLILSYLYVRGKATDL